MHFIDLQFLDLWMGPVTIIPDDLDNVESIKWYLNNVHDSKFDNSYGWAGVFTLMSVLRIEVIIEGGCNISQEYVLSNNKSSAIGNGNIILENENLYDNNSIAYDVIIYPNPANDNITVKLPNEGSSYVFLMNLDGKLIKNENKSSSEFELDLSSVHQGTYIIYIMQGKNKFSKKIVVN